MKTEGKNIDEGVLCRVCRIHCAHCDILFLDNDDDEYVYVCSMQKKAKVCVKIFVYFPRSSAV